MDEDKVVGHDLVDHEAPSPEVICVVNQQVESCRQALTKALPAAAVEPHLAVFRYMLGDSSVQVPETNRASMVTTVREIIRKARVFGSRTPSL